MSTVSTTLYGNMSSIASQIQRCVLALLMLISLFVATNITGQTISGSHTLGPSSSIYPTFNAAFDSLEANGVSGPVIFEIEDGIYEDMKDLWMENELQQKLILG